MRRSRAHVNVYNASDFWFNSHRAGIQQQQEHPRDFASHTLDIDTRSRRLSLMKTRDVAIPLHLLLDHTTYHVRLAYRAASTLWPERTLRAHTLDPRDAGVLRKWTNGDWQALVGVDDEADGMPNWLHAKMRRLYPLFHDARAADG